MRSPSQKELESRAELYMYLYVYISSIILVRFVSIQNLNLKFMKVRYLVIRNKV